MTIARSNQSALAPGAYASEVALASSAADPAIIVRRSIFIIALPRSHEP
jgi:hypothetical protein